MTREEAIKAVREALEGHDKLYSHVWDLTDGNIAILAKSSIANFEKAAKRTQEALALLPLLESAQDMQAVRDQALEDAALRLDKLQEGCRDLKQELWYWPKECSAEIRAMKSQPTASLESAWRPELDLSMEGLIGIRIDGDATYLSAKQWHKLASLHTASPTEK